MMRACRKAVTAIAMCSAILGVASIDSVSAQSVTACSSLPATMSICGRSYRWTAAANGLYVLRCPASAQGVQTTQSWSGSYGPGSNPNFRVCGSYGTDSAYGSCEVGSNQIWFFRGGPNGPDLEPHSPVTFTASRSSLQAPYCTPGSTGTASCAGCSANMEVRVVFEDTAGFLTTPTATGKAQAPTCSADGQVVGSQSVALSLHLDAPPADDSSVEYASNLNQAAGTSMTGSQSGTALTNFHTGTGQTNNANFDVLLVDQAGAGTIATVSSVAFDANGDAAVTIALPSEYSASGARTDLSFNVILRSLTTGKSSAFSAAVPVTLQTCTASSTPTTTPPQSEGQEVTSTGGGLDSVPDNSNSNPTTTTSTAASGSTTPTTTTPATTTSTGTPASTTPATSITTSTGAAAGGSSSTPSTSTPTQGGGTTTTTPGSSTTTNPGTSDGSVSTTPASSAAASVRGAVLAVAVAAASATMVLLA